MVSTPPASIVPPRIAAVIALILAACLLAPLASWGADAAGDVQPSAADPLFDSIDPLQLRISAPLHAMARDRADDPEERTGVVTLLAGPGAGAPDQAGGETAFQIKIRPRGNSRRDRAVCKFPPLRLNFRKGDVKGTVFAGQDKLKLVTHCRSGERHEPYPYKEYLVYRMLNQVTDAGFRVRPLTIRYHDSERDQDAGEHFGFFIESDDGLARRLGLEESKLPRIETAQLEPRHASLMDLFQYMIGNTDYSFIAGPAGESCCHNTVLMQNDEGLMLPMPYDFDITGFVDPPYAVVDGQLPIRNVRTRLYRGLCRDDDTHQRAADHFRDRRDGILQPVRLETPLAERDRQKAVAFILSFYEILDDPRQLDRKVFDDCRG